MTRSTKTGLTLLGFVIVVIAVTVPLVMYFKKKDNETSSSNQTTRTATSMITTATRMTTATKWTTKMTAQRTTSTTSTPGMAYGVNLLFNGDAEIGPCSVFGNTQPPTGWLYTPGILQISFSYPDIATCSVSGFSDCGQCFFEGGWGNTNMKQTINLSPYSLAIDSGMVSFNLSAWLGGYLEFDDNAEVTISFLNGLSQAVGNLTMIGPIWAIDRNYTTMFLFRQNSGLVPINARYMTATVIFTCYSGFNSLGTADNIAVVFSHV